MNPNPHTRFKKVLISLVITIGLCIWLINGVEAQYHIRVQCYYNPDNQKREEYQFYSIEYTSDNWKSIKIFKSTWDSSDEIAGNDVVYQEKLFDSGKGEAIEFAKGFKTFAECENYNLGVLQRYKELSAYRKKHPIIIPKVVVKKSQCCKITNIY